MSAAALRAPAPWHRVARAEAGALLRSRWTLPLLIVIVLLTMGPVGADTGRPFGEIRTLAALMFFLPLVHWRGRGVRGSLDQAMPGGTVAYDLLRVGVGAAAALAVMGIATQAHTWVFVSQFDRRALAGFAPGYAAALVVRGLAAYLLGSAVLLRARRPGGVLLVAFVIGSLALFYLGGLETTTKNVRYAPDGTETVTFGSSLTLGAALLQLAVTAAVVCLAAWLGRHAGRGRSGRWARGGGTDASTRAPASIAPARRALPRRPASLAAVAVRQFAVQVPQMVWLGVTTSVGALLYATGWMSSLYTGSFVLLWFAAFFWPLLVWMDERGGHGWDESQPVSPFARRLLHAAAGLVWLELCLVVLLAGHVVGAAAAGTLASAEWIPSWVLPGLPLSVMAVYCVGTLPAVLVRRPAAAAIAAFLVMSPVVHLLAGARAGGHGPLSIARVFAPLGLGAEHDWSLPAALVWIPVLALLAIAALRRQTNLDRGGTARTPLPRPLNAVP